MRDYSPTRPLVTEVDLAQLSDKEWRYAWADPKLRWSIAKQVHDIRVHRGWTQEELAERSGVAFATINRVENPNGGWSLTLGTLLKIAEAFDLALLVRFCAWSEWLKFMAQLEAEGLWTPPRTYDEEVSAGR